MPEASVTAPRPLTGDEKKALVARAREGDESVLPALRRMLRTDAGYVHWLGGDLSHQAELSLTNALCGKNATWREAILIKCELMRAELAGPNPTPLEKLLVARVVTCWLQCAAADATEAQQSGLSPRMADHYARAQDRAHRRYMSAMRTLALCRKLAVPVMQVNVTAGDQMNIVGGQTLVNRGNR